MSKLNPHPLIEPFLDALWLERGCPTTRSAPIAPILEKFALWLDEQRVPCCWPGLDDIQHYLAWRVDHQFAASSTARFLSALRRFLYQYLNRGCAATSHRAAGGPKLPKKLPARI